MVIRYFSNGTKTVRGDNNSAAALLTQKDEKGEFVWTEVENPNPPAPTREQLILADHTGQIEIKHIASGKIAWCDSGQCQAMLDSGWELAIAGSWASPDEPKEESKVEPPKKVSKTPVSEVATQDAQKIEDAQPATTETNAWDEPGPVANLRATLIGLDRTADKFWKMNGEINITGLREIVPNVTRKEVDTAFPGFNRESTPVSASAE